jgi:glycosyltransferase involved in cell wall biosynthesis
MISAVVITKNEEKNIKECLAGLSWCDEIIVVDDNSDDKTQEIARKMGAKVFARSLNKDFAAQRNFGLEKATGEWVLFADADERVSEALWYEVMAHTNDPANAYSGFYLKRNDVLWGKELKYGEIGNIKLLRLARKDAGLWQGKVHEEWKIKGKTLLLQKSLLHFPHSTVETFLQEINFYTDLRAEELYKKKAKVYWWSVILYPKAKFFLNFVLRQGYKDGLPGLVFALMMSFHSFLVRGKLWQLSQKGIK